MSHRMTWDGASAVLFAFLVGLVALTFGHYGNGFDAEVQDVYGRQIVAWYRSLGADQSALHYIDLFYYGGLFDMLAALINQVSPWAHWATRHLLEAVFGLIGMAGCWRLARHLGGALAGFAALACLALMPSYYGMMFINPKDIPFAALMIWAVYLLTRIAESLPRTPWRLVAAFGVMAGLALGVRIGGVLLFGYLGLIALFTPGNRLTMAVRLAPALPLAWLVMLIFWPWAQVSPFFHPYEALRHFAGMQNNIDTLFLGREIGKTYHPALYLPVYIGVKLPDLVLTLLAAGTVIGLWRVRQGVSRRLIPTLLAAFFPLAYAMLTRPELYDADRHFLFILPPVAVLVGLTTAQLAASVKRLETRTALASVALLAVAWQIRQMSDLHPYEYAFFNDLVGGTRHAAGEFETEYWGASLAEATGDLSRYIHSHNMTRPVPWRVAVCGKISQMGDPVYPQLQPTTDWRTADFFVATTRGACDRRLPGRTIGDVERDGVTFAIVKDLRHSGAS